MSTSISQRGLTYLGLDVSKNSISCGILRPDEHIADCERIFHDEPSVRRLVRNLGDPTRLRACYEAGPTGYELYRLLMSLGVRTEVIAPSLIPKAPGERVKTDRRDCRKLARLFRAGELTAIRVPSPQEEAVRDLARARADAVADRLRARQRLAALLLRHNKVFRDGRMWTLRHRLWLDGVSFPDAALQTTLDHYRAIVTKREREVEALEADLATWYDRPPFADGVARLGAYRGITALGALVLLSEVCDWRRFATARGFMGFAGLVPSEYSSGERVYRGAMTCTGNHNVRTQLVESAWAYRFPARVTPALARRQREVAPDVVARSWTAQLRLCGRYRHMAARKDRTTVVVGAIARELAGFVWAEMTA